MTLPFKLLEAERQVDRLLALVPRQESSLLEQFPRPVEDILCCALAVTFERVSGLNEARVGTILASRFGLTGTAVASRRLAGYTYARGKSAVVFLNTDFGPAAARFTLAHEAGHIAVEHLPRLAQAAQGSLFGDAEVATLARRDPPSHLFLGGGTGTPTGEDAEDFAALRRDQAAWLREVVANAFAAELLAPHREVIRVAGAAPGDDARVAALTARFGLSAAASRIRLSELGLLKTETTNMFFVS